MSWVALEGWTSTSQKILDSAKKTYSIADRSLANDNVEIELLDGGTVNDSCFVPKPSSKALIRDQVHIHEDFRN